MPYTFALFTLLGPIYLARRLCLGSCYHKCLICIRQEYYPPLTPPQVFGLVFEAIGQPVINGYLIAGALVGPGGLRLIKASSSVINVVGAPER
jgi:hypothetical protein